MEISDILKNRIAPFEIVDEKMKSLFSFYLHLAPTVDSKSAKSIPARGVSTIWKEFIAKIAIKQGNYYIYKSGNINEKQLDIYRLKANHTVNRKSKGFVCCYKNDEKDELVCLLRHIRNSIAHSNVYLLDKTRKYVIFDDYNSNKNLTARVLLSQTDLNNLRKLLVK
ncbi:MAG: HEPN family nuclease [Lachnospiraceae bacterium]|nr:HEPN family nuclease [Lachnospiraceae bacterium]